jgi:probable HAF family extracellular repeat protein
MAARWTSGGGWQALGTLPGSTFTSATAISADGSMVAGYGDSAGGGMAFRWNITGGMRPLGTLPGGAASYAFAISGDGSMIAGSATTAFGGGSAMMWTDALGMVDLNTYLPSLGVDLSGWNLAVALGISADGSAIVGDGFYNGQERAWVVTGVPEPSALAMLGLGVLQVSRRRRC